MNAPTLFFAFSLPFFLVACGNAAPGAGSGGATTSGTHGSSVAAGTGGATATSSTSSASASGAGGAGGGAATSSTSAGGGAATSSSSAGGGGSTGAGGACTTSPTFAQVLAKPLSSCSGLEPPCHNHDAAMLSIQPTMQGATWSQLVNVQTYTAGAGVRVVPGDPENSFLWRKLTDQLGPNDGLPMPHSGLATGWNELPADEIEMVRCWILEGAPND